ncbi:MAG: Mur ligase family protein, partial [Armatimonadota bacterium]
AAGNVPQDARTIVVGRHARLVPATNPEVAHSHARRAEGRARIASFPEVLRDRIGDSPALIVAGSYGKSSCSALAAWCLAHAGARPGWFVGADAPDLVDNGRLGEGGPFVIEGDEYPAAIDDPRPKFAFYPVDALLLTAAEHDHVNVYPTVDSYLEPFRTLAERVPGQGRIVACATGPHLDTVVAAAAAPVVRYAADAVPGADWHAEDIRPGARTTFGLVHRGKRIGGISTGLLGRHNVENIVGVAALLLEGGYLSFDAFAAAVSAFRGVRRRLERLTPDHALPVYSDFGSSRAKCLAGIHTLREAFPDRRIVVCFEPHTFSFRNRDALHWYDDLFARADHVLVHHPPTHGADTHEQLGLDEIVARIRASGVAADPVDNAEAVLAALANLDPNRDLIVFETSGSFDGAIPRVVEAMRNARPPGEGDSAPHART